MNFRYEALFYLNQWLERDRPYFEGLCCDDHGRQRDVLARAAGFYRIARALPKTYDEGRRYEPVREILSRTQRKLSETEVLSVIRDVQASISEAYGYRGVLSPTTKFLWLWCRDPVLIYDSQARRTLRTKEGDLEGFYEAWYRAYDRHAKDIGAACESLTSVVSYSANPSIPVGYVASIAREPWFRQRVLDIHLWRAGRPPG
jgi:hypothetical protein